MFDRIFRTRNVIPLILIVILMAVAYAFAAANVVPETGAGDGSNTISGYTVTTVNYVLNATNPANIDQVDLVLTPTDGASAPTSVEIQLDGGSWHSCTLNVGTWECPVTGVTAAAAANLRVVAAE